MPVKMNIGRDGFAIIICAPEKLLGYMRLETVLVIHRKDTDPTICVGNTPAVILISIVEGCVGERYETTHTGAVNKSQRSFAV